MSASHPWGWEFDSLLCPGCVELAYSYPDTWIWHCIMCAITAHTASHPHSQGHIYRHMFRWTVVLWPCAALLSLMVSWFSAIVWSSLNTHTVSTDCASSLAASALRHFVCVCVFNQWMQLFVSSSDGFYIKRTAIMQGCQCLLFTTSSAWMYVLFWYQWISLLIVKVTQYLWQYVMIKNNFRTLRFSEICVSYQDSIWVYGYADLANLYLVSIVPV